MALQIAINLILAVIWMVLQNDWTFPGLIVGYGLGMLVLLAFRRFFQSPPYTRKLWAGLKLLMLFLKELALSGFAVARRIVAPKLDIRPGIFAYKTELKSDWEVTTLACLICLTPGTLTLDVSEDNRTLYIHALDIGDADTLSEQIRGTFEKAIVEVSRS